MRELICITCPKGCHLKVDEENGYKVTGNGCPRGAIYGKKECTHPTRVVTSTVKIVGAEIERLSVKTNGDILVNRAIKKSPARTTMIAVCLRFRLIQSSRRWKMQSGISTNIIN